MTGALYRELILEEYKHPRNRGRVASPTHEAHVRNPLCGDELTVTLNVQDNCIRDIKFDGKGCALSIASSSIFTEHVKGKTIAEVQAMDERVLLSLLGVTPNPMRMKCAVLIMRALANALGSATSGETHGET